MGAQASTATPTTMATRSHATCSLLLMRPMEGGTFVELPHTEMTRSPERAGNAQWMHVAGQKGDGSDA
jgi:hypothetical protein